MSSILKGNKLSVSVFGQSHSECIGAVIDGLPAGAEIDRDRINAFMGRRAPGQNFFSTLRKETDRPEFLSGLVDEHKAYAVVADELLTDYKCVGESSGLVLNGVLNVHSEL